MTPEGRVKAAVKRLLSKYGAKVYVHWPVQMGYGAPTLDAVGCANGRYFAIETKAPGAHPTERQQLTIADVRRANGYVYVIGEQDTGEAGPYRYSGMAELDSFLSCVCRLPPA